MLETSPQKCWAHVVKSALDVEADYSDLGPLFSLLQMNWLISKGASVVVLDDLKPNWLDI